VALFVECYDSLSVVGKIQLIDVLMEMLIAQFPYGQDVVPNCGLDFSHHLHAIHG